MFLLSPHFRQSGTSADTSHERQRRLLVELAELSDVRTVDSEEMAANIKSGRDKHHAKFPVSRGFGPLYPIYGLDGLVVMETDNRHPFGPQKRKYQRVDFGEEADDSGIDEGSDEE